MLRACALIVIMLLLSNTGSRAADDDHLYKAVAFVTGTEEPERSRGFRDGLREVFAKLTGDALFAEDDRLRPYLNRVGELVASFDYEDRMKGIPVHDEQGTRERPHFLRITFKRRELDAALVNLAKRKWDAPRPLLGVLVLVDIPKGGFILRNEGAEGYGQRESLRSVSEKRAVPILLPASSQKITASDIRSGDPYALKQWARSVGADCSLSGVLSLDKKGIYWNMNWMLRCGTVDSGWSLSGVTFDKAFANGLERSAKLLSQAAAQ